MPNAVNESRIDAPDAASQDAEQTEYPRVARTTKASTSQVSIGDVTFGDGDFVVIAGPCSIESSDQIDRIAALVRDHGARVLRGGAFKPRTSPYSFQGLGLEGIELMRRASLRHDIPIVTEIMGETALEEMEPRVDAFQVGARNMQNYDLLRALGQTDKPVLLKRNFGATLREWMLAAEYIAAGGNERIILCERGIRTFDVETRFTLDLAGALWAKERTHLPVIVDPSHATGLPGLIPKLAAAAVATELDGVMVEVHDQREEALSDADQALSPTQFDELIDRVTAITAATGRKLKS
ncbi:MAG: 3-deoxy-7-phosphoheptulonate synthase [Myxococcota bacterium]